MNDNSFDLPSLVSLTFYQSSFYQASILQLESSCYFNSFWIDLPCLSTLNIEYNALRIIKKLDLSNIPFTNGQITIKQPDYSFTKLKSIIADESSYWRIDWFLASSRLKNLIINSKQ